MNWLYDLTDYLVFNDDFLIEEYQDNKKENLDDKKKEAIVLKEEPPKYEEKFMHSFYQNNKDSDLTSEEELQKENYLQEEKEKMENKRKEIKDKLDFWYDEKMNRKDSVLEDSVLEDYKKEDYKKEILKNITLLEKKNEDFNLSIHKLEEQAVQYILSKRLEKLKNSFIMEKTPLGNVIMYYNVNRESFEYFSDSTIPYRFLEVVARKYVITFQCRFIYVMM